MALLMVVCVATSPLEGQSPLNINHAETMKVVCTTEIPSAPQVKVGNRFVDRTGQVHGKLKVVSLARIDRTWKPTRVYWNCICECGEITQILSTNLSTRPPQSCIKCKGVIHGCSRTPEYWAFKAMLFRCNDARCHQYKNYGGRGIKVCPQWNHISKFEDFLASVGKRPSSKHSLDRIDNDGNYEPTNVRWATKYEQTANTRKNVMVTFRGETLHGSEMARRYGKNPSIFLGKLRDGKTVAQALGVTE